MALSLKDIGNKILHPLQTNASVANPLIYLNPLTAIASPRLLFKNLSAYQKQLAAKKAAAAGVAPEDLTYQLAPDGSVNIADKTAQDDKTKFTMPMWATITITVIGVTGVALLIGFIVKKARQ